MTKKWGKSIVSQKIKKYKITNCRKALAEFAIIE